MTRRTARFLPRQFSAGVSITSNYRYDLAPYTWQLMQQLKSGRATFSQPPMPIKCAGAPQKAMYLPADHWRRTGVLSAWPTMFPP